MLPESQPEKPTLSMPLRLGIITSHLPFGSSEAFLYPELKELIELGHNLTIFPAAPRNMRRVHNDVAVQFVKYPLFAPQTFFRAWQGLRRNPRAAGSALALILRSKNALWTKLKNLALFPISLAVADEARRRGISHLHAYWLSGPATVALIASRVSNVSWSYSAHSWDIFMEDNLIAEKLSSASFGRAISEQGQHALQNRSDNPGSAPIEVIHLGVASRNQHLVAGAQRPSGRINLLCPAYLLPVKGHEYLLEALRRVIDAGIDCQCVFAGEGRLRDALAQKTRDLKLENVVSMPGMIPHDAFLEQLNQGMYDAIVLASVQIGTEFEGIPVSLMEAMAAGIPCIATRTGAIAELIDAKCGILVEQRNPVALSDAIVKLAVNPSYRKELGARARQRIAQDFDAKTSAGSLAALIHQAEIRRP